MASIGLVVEVACDERVEEVELVHVVGVLSALEVEELGSGEIGRGGEIVDDEDVAFGQWH